MTIDVIGEILFYAIPATPVIGWLIVYRQKHWSAPEKFMAVLGITTVLSVFFFLIAMGILLRNGLGSG